MSRTLLRGSPARGEAFDEQPMPGLDSEALDFRAASESFAHVRKLGRGDLETLRLVTVHQGRKVPFSPQARLEAGFLLRRLQRGERFIPEVIARKSNQTPQTVIDVCRRRLREYDV